MQRSVFFLIPITAVFAASVGTMACRPGDGDAAGARFEGEIMGTSYLVRLSEELSPETAQSLDGQIASALTDVDSKMSHYSQDSELSRFNRAAPFESVRVSAETIEVFQQAARTSRLTHGAFDVTVAPLVALWNFGPGATELKEVPDAAAIEQAQARMGMEHVVIDDDEQVLSKDVAGLSADLSAIAKGYAVDRVAVLLEALGYRDYMVEVGGEVRTSGKSPRGEAWRIAIERPVPVGREGYAAQDFQRVVTLSGFSIATSGDYRNFHELNGKLYSHLIDPRSGRPVEHQLASVSVIGDSCMEVDALASGLLVLGPVEGFALAEELDLIALFLIRDADGQAEEKATRSFVELFGP